MADPSTSVRTAATVSTIAKDAINVGRGLVLWIETLRQNPKKLDELLKGLAEAKEFLDRVKDWFSNVPSQSSIQYHQRVVECRLGNALAAHKRLHEQVMKAVERANKKRSKVYPSVVNDFLKENQQALKDLSSEFIGIASDVKDFEKAANENKTGDGGDSGDRFKRVTNMVPNNPPGMVMDFDSTENGTPLTPEGKLLAAVVDTTTRECVGAIARGQGGVGKTCALRAVGCHKDTVDRFAGGILYVTIGHNATEQVLIRRVSKIVECAGGVKKAEAVRQADDLEETVRISAEWFQNPTLFLFDDIWLRNGITSESVVSLSKLAHHEGSRIVYTSREWVQDAGEHIMFEPRDCNDKQCREMLCKHAGVEEPVSEKAKEAFSEVLESCGGLPIALGVVGGTVRRLTATRCGNKPELAWQEYRKAWKSSKGKEMIDRMLISLEVLDGDGNEGVHRRRFESLCVLREGQYVTMDVLGRLWGVSRTMADEEVDILEGVSIVRVVMEEDDDGWRTVAGLHDILLNISRRLAGDDSGFREHSTAVLKSYISCSEPEGDAAFSQEFCSNWVRVEDDGYIHKNVCWLLRCACMRSEMMWLMGQPEWMIKQLKVHGESQSRDDTMNARECVKCEEGCTETEEEDMEYLNVIESAIRLSKREVLSCSWDGMGWFQLYGRLLESSGRNGRTRKMVEEIGRGARRPWLKPSVGCVISAGGAAREIIKVSGEVRCFADLGKVIRILHEENKRLVVTDYTLKTGDESERIELCEDFGAMICSARGESGNEEEKTRIWSATFSQDGRLLILGLGNGDVIVCGGGESKEVSAGEREYGVRLEWGGIGLRGHTGEVQSVSASKDGAHVVSGSCDGTVRVWQKEGGSWKSSVLEGHTGSVESVNVSMDGAHVVSGGVDKTVRVWQEEGGMWRGSVLEGHTGVVKSVKVSMDGAHVVSGDSDNRIRLWQKEGGMWRRSVPQKHGGVGPIVVSMSMDGVHVVSGGLDRTVRVWQKEGAMWRKSVLKGHTGTVMSVSVSMDGAHIVSGGSDSTVRVWQKEGGKWRSSVPKGHTGWLGGVSVSVSMDGAHVVSGGMDRTVRVWQKVGRMWRSSVLEGHTQWVLSVSVSMDGAHVVSGGVDKTVRVWQKEGGVWRRLVLKGHMEVVKSVSVSMDGAHVVSGGMDKTVRVWQKEGGMWRSSVLEGHTGVVSSVSVSMDGAHVVSGGWDNSIRVWQKEGGLWRSSVLEGHTGWVKSVSMSMDGTRVVSGGDDKTVRIWQKDGGMWSCCLIREVNVSVDSVETVHLHEDSREIIVMTNNNWKMTWRIEGDRWVEVKCEHVMATWQGVDILNEEEIAEVVKATDARQIRKTANGYVLTIDRAPYVAFVDVEL